MSQESAKPQMPLLKQAALQIAAGGSAGFVEVCIMHPLDLVKTRLQIQTKGGSCVAMASNSVTHTHTLDSKPYKCHVFNIKEQTDRHFDCRFTTTACLIASPKCTAARGCARSGKASFHRFWPRPRSGPRSSCASSSTSDSLCLAGIRRRLW